MFLAASESAMPQLLDEIVALTKTTRSSMSQRRFSPLPHLPSDGLCLYGSEAGDDYARSSFDLLKDALRQTAQTPEGHFQTALPRGGDAAYASMQTAFEQMLEGFHVTVGKNHLRVEWEHCC
jgi:hypothetical protein